MPGGEFVSSVRIDRPAEGADRYPFSLPAVGAVVAAGGLALDPGVTFVVGENGSGKSTLIEAIAVALGFNAEGGSQNFNFHTNRTESTLGPYLTLIRSSGRTPQTGYFLRAESYYNVATEIENLEREQSGLLDAYGGVSPHAQSHGESFLRLLLHRFGTNGMYVLDEPEAALSVRGAMAAIARIAELTAEGSQFVIATHSPILLALPDATIMQIGDDGRLASVAYDDALPVQATRDFLADPQRTLRHLL